MMSHAPISRLLRRAHAPRFGRRLLTIAATLGLAAVSGLVACTSKVDSSQEVAKERREWKGPLAVVVDVAVERGDLSVDQEEAVLAIRDREEADHHAARALKKRMRASLAQAVRAGTADSEEFQRAVEEATDAIVERITRTSAAIEEVHQMLDSDQRAAVAEGLRDYLDQRYAQRERRKAHKSGFKKYAAYLMLTNFQIDELKKLREQLVGERKRLRPSREELEALIDAFEGEDFAAAVDEFHADKLVILQEHVGAAGEHADYALALLSDDQRASLADLVERGPEALGLEKDEHAYADNQQ
jgi:hypothetical protein